MSKCLTNGLVTNAPATQAAVLGTKIRAARSVTCNTWYLSAGSHRCPKTYSLSLKNIPF